MYRFQHTQFLIGLLILLFLAALFWAVVIWKKKAINKIGNPSLVKELIKQYSPLKFFLKFLLPVLAIAAVIIGIANLQKPGMMEDIDRKGVDVIIAWDVSKSMLAQDIKPNRLENARQFVYKLMANMPNDRIGLVLFAGRAYLQMPLTIDHGAAKMYVQAASPDVVPTQGTMISEALKLSSTAFNAKDKKFKSIVLITDGEDHDPTSIQVAQQLAGDAIMINTIGIGSPEGAPILHAATNDYKKDEQGNTVISKLNEQQLQQMAQETKGIYIRLADADAAVKAVMQQLSTIEKTEMEDKAFKDYKSYFQWFLAGALVLLIIEFFLPERKWKVA